MIIFIYLYFYFTLIFILCIILICHYVGMIFDQYHIFILVLIIICLLIVLYFKRKSIFGGGLVDDFYNLLNFGEPRSQDEYKLERTLRTNPDTMNSLGQDRVYGKKSDVLNEDAQPGQSDVYPRGQADVHTKI